MVYLSFKVHTNKFTLQFKNTPHSFLKWETFPSWRNMKRHRWQYMEKHGGGTFEGFNQDFIGYCVFILFEW